MTILIGKIGLVVGGYSMAEAKVPGANLRFEVFRGGKTDHRVVPAGFEIKG